MDRKLITYDIDGVTCNTARSLSHAIRAKLGIPFKVNDITQYDTFALLTQKYGVNLKSAHEIIALYSDPEFLRSLRPYTIAQVCIPVLQCLGFDAAFASSRPTSCTDITELWSLSHFPSVSQVHVLASDKENYIATTLQPVRHIDDRAYTVVRINDLSPDTPARLITRSWNRHEDVPDEYRLKIGWFSFVAQAMHVIMTCDQY